MNNPITSPITSDQLDLDNQNNSQVSSFTKLKEMIRLIPIDSKSYDTRLVILLIILFNSIVFHFEQSFYCVVFVLCFIFSFISFCLVSMDNLEQFEIYSQNLKTTTNHKKKSLLKIDDYLEMTSEVIELYPFKSSSSSSSLTSLTSINSFLSFKTATASAFQVGALSSSSSTNKPFQVAKPDLTGSYQIDDELHKIIELIIRDYIDVWYKNNISSRDQFPKNVKNAIYDAIRNVTLSLKTIDWEMFLMNQLAHNLVSEQPRFI
jgi:hypothetical protein